MLRVLILGGTADARALASVLDTTPGIHPITSLAGRVSAPAHVAGEVRVGGFGGVAGLTAWLAEHRIDAVVDATHPFAAVISASAARATADLGIPLIALRRPGWTERPGDDWHRVPSLDTAAGALAGLGERVFLTTGRLELAPFVPLDAHWFLIRSIDPPAVALPRRHEILLARGPFSVPDERALLVDRRVDVLVSKDSGGALTEAKLTAARELCLPVVLVDRPSLPGVRSVSDVDAVVEWLSRGSGAV